MSYCSRLSGPKRNQEKRYPHYPALRGQATHYIAQQLRLFRDGTAAARPMLTSWRRSQGAAAMSRSKPSRRIYARLRNAERLILPWSHDRGWSAGASGSGKQQGAVAGAERDSEPNLLAGARREATLGAAHEQRPRPAHAAGLHGAARRIGRAGLAARGADLPHAPARCLSRKRAEALCGGPAARNRLGRSVGTW